MTKTVLITGGGTGIGRALTLELARYGFNIYIVGRREDKLLEVHSCAPLKVSYIVADVSSDEGRSQIKEALMDETLDYLVHNAAVTGPLQTLETISPQQWRDCFSINVDAPLFLTQALLPNLKKGSRILHVSSGLAHNSLPGMGSYACTKAALHMIYLAWNCELSDRGIIAGSIQPGVVETPMQASLRESNDSDVFPSNELFKSFKLDGKLITPETSAKVMSWMLREMDDAHYVERDWRWSDDVFDGVNANVQQA